MQPPIPIIYVTPCGRMCPRLRAAGVVAFAEHLRVSLKPALALGGVR